MARSIDDMSFNDGYAEREESGSAFDQLDLQHYMRILRKYKIPITLFTAAITALAGYYAYTATPIYSATATLLIESQANSPITFEQLVGAETENQEYYSTQYELLQSRGLAKRVVDRLNLWEHPEFSSGADSAPAGNSGVPGSTESGGVQPDERGLSSAVTSLKKLFGIESSEPADNGVVIDLDNPEASINSTAGISGQAETVAERQLRMSAEFANNADGSAFSLELDADAFGDTDQLTQQQQRVVNSFMGRLSVDPVRKTKLVNLSFESPDPVFAALVANTVGEEYINSYLDAKIELTTRASVWLNQRLSELKTTLDGSEDRLIAFQQANGLVDVEGSVGRLTEQQLLLVTAELAQARSDLSASENLYREVQALNGDAELLGTMPAFQADPLIQRVKIDQGQAQRTLDELRNRYGERHPRVVDAQSQLNTLNATLEGNVKRVVGSLANDYQLAQQRVASIEAKLNVGKTEIQDIGTKKFELDALQREVDTNRAIYDTFFSRITEAKSADGLEAANARISDYALPPVGPFKPKKQLIIALAALGSLVLSMLMAFLYEQMDETIKGTNDIEGRLGLKLLGILPLIKGGMFNRGKRLPISPLEIPQKNRTFAEAVNTARTAISLDDGETVRKIITITSSVPGEGKSTAAINLAYSLSQLERVLLIDCDMRRPTIAKAAGHDRNVPGLSSLITQTVPARQCIIRGAYNGSFDIMPSGPLAEQPLELLSSKRFEKILEQLGNHYDRIVIDSAPTQAVSDALVLAKLSDAVVYIIKSHDTTMELVKRGTDRLRQVNAPLAGVLMTQVDIDKITSYGGDYYYQGYYDYYGYHEENGADGKRVSGKLRLSQQELMDIRSDDSDVDLDLDYNIGHNERRAAKAPRHTDYILDDFDTTAEVDYRSSRSNGTTRRRANEDLDLL